MTRNNPILIVVAMTCFSSGIYAQSPGGVSTNLSLWMKAESALPIAGGTLTQWKDEKNVNTFSISGTASTITTVKNVINFHSVVRFTASAKLVGNTSIGWSECSAVASWSGGANTERGTVLSPTISGTATNDASRYFFRSGVEGSTGYVYTGMGVDSIGFEYLNAPASGEVNLYTASGVNDVFNKNGLDARVGSLYGGFTPRATVMTSPPQIGDRSTNDAKLKGDIAEIILYSQNNATNRNRVESYLALKYGLTLGTTASPIGYVSSNGTTFWGALSSYQNNIFGIGADAGSGLTQTQSNSMNTGSGNGTGQSGKGNMVLTAISALTDQQFLMIGSDASTLSEEGITAAIGPAVAVSSARVTRTWKVRNTGSVGAVTLTFDKSGQSYSGGSTASNYWLVIDKDGDGNFTTGVQDFVHATSITSNVILFNNVTLPNNAVFTIITKPSSTTVLSFDWKDLTATARQEVATLQWTVQQDENILRYDIERSINATDFVRTGSLPSRQTTDGGEYTYSEQTGPGSYFYRIRAIGADGHTIFSPVRSVLIAGPTREFLRLRSNPVTGGSLLLDIWLPEKNTAFIHIIGREGKQLYKKSYTLLQGSNLVTIDVGGFPAGLYFIQARAGQDNKTLSFLK